MAIRLAHNALRQLAPTTSRMKWFCGRPDVLKCSLSTLADVHCTVQLTARQAGVHSSLLNLSCFALISVQKVPKRFIVICTVEQVVKLHNEVLPLFFFELLNYSLSLVILKGFCLFL